jgi:hypothetical protein
MKATAWELEDSTSVIMHTDDSVLIIQGGGEVVLNKEQLEQILSLFTKKSSGTKKQVKKSLEDLKVGDKCLCVYNARYPNLYTEHETYLVAEIHEDCVTLEDNISPVRWSFTENHHFREMFDVLI